MNNIWCQVFARYALVAAAVLTCICFSADPADGKNHKFRLRVSDATGTPGGLMAVVVRTYAPRGIEQGQLCFGSESSERGYGATPFSSLEKVVVFSADNDAQYEATFEQSANDHTVMVSFNSATASINRVEGPLLAFYFRLDPTVEIGRKFGLEFYEQESFLVDESGESVELEFRGGELTIRDPAEPYILEADGDKVRPGELAELGLETAEPLALSSGQFGIRYDPDVTTGPASITVDPRFGNAVFNIEDVAAGHVVVSFVSPDRSFNRLPGEILKITVPTSSDTVKGAVTPVSLDPDLTYVVDWAGTRVFVELEDGVLKFR